MRSYSYVVFAALLGMVTTVAVPQQVVPPPPKPVDGGASLAVTMQFLQTRLSELGAIYYAAYIVDNATGREWVEQVGVETRGVRADAAACRIEYHLKNTTDGKVSYDHDEAIPLHEVQSLEVRTGVQHRKRLDSSDGHPTWDARMDPPLFVVVIRRSGKDTDWFYFGDEDTASRVARGMVHAVELCGGGNRDPF